MWVSRRVLKVWRQSRRSCYRLSVVWLGCYVLTLMRRPLHSRRLPVHWRHVHRRLLHHRLRLLRWIVRHPLSRHRLHMLWVRRLRIIPLLRRRRHHASALLVFVRLVRAIRLLSTVYRAVSKRESINASTSCIVQVWLGEQTQLL